MKHFSTLVILLMLVSCKPTKQVIEITTGSNVCKVNFSNRGIDNLTFPENLEFPTDSTVYAFASNKRDTLFIILSDSVLFSYYIDAKGLCQGSKYHVDYKNQQQVITEYRDGLKHGYKSFYYNFTEPFQRVKFYKGKVKSIQRNSLF